MSKFTTSYKGYSPDYISVEQFQSLFDGLWKKENRHLPSYPEVIGGIGVSWEDGNGNIHKVTHFDELIQAYTEEKTAEIKIEGHVGSDTPRITFVYIPSKKKAGIAVTGEEGAAFNCIEIIKEYFPMQAIPIIFISYATPELPYADFLKNVLETRLKGNAKVFVAKRNIGSGQHPFNTMLNENLLKAEAIIPICSALSKESNWLWWETSSVWTRGASVFPLFANISPNEFGEPMKSLFQGKDFFNPVEVNEMMTDLAARLNPPTSLPELTEEERAQLSELSRFKINNTSHETVVRREKEHDHRETDKHIYTLGFYVTNKGKQEYKDIALELLFPVIALERTDWNYPHLRSELVEDGKTLKLMFQFSSLREQGQAQFKKDLLPGCALKIFGKGGLTNFLYIANKEVNWQKDSLEIRWRLFIDGYLVEEGFKPFADGFIDF